MSWDGNEITPAVSIYDLQYAFGVAEGGDEGKVIQKIVNDGLINIWAKFKPEYHSGVECLTNTDRENTNTRAHTVSGYNISYGIKKPTSYGISDYIVNGVVQSGLWDYDKPTGGGSSCPWRITDFLEVNNSGEKTGRGYSITATSPIGIVLPDTNLLPIPSDLTNGQSTYLNFGFYFERAAFPWNANTCMSLTDIFATEKEYYPTVILTCYSGGTQLYAKSADNKVKYYAAQSNPFAQILVDTKVLGQAITYDSGYGLTNGTVWTACVVLTDTKIAGTRESHGISGSVKICRLEATAGCDRKSLTVQRSTMADEIRSMKMKIVLTREATNKYYLNNSSSYIKISFSNNKQYTLNIDTTFQSLYGTVSGTGWNPSQRVDITSWGTLSINNEQGSQEHTKYLSAMGVNPPSFTFDGSIPQNPKVATLQFMFKNTDGTYLSASFGIDVSGGASSYDSGEQTIV